MAQGQTTTVEDTKLLATSGVSNSHYGYAVAPAGDVNGDGFSDLIIGGYGDDNGGGGFGGQIGAAYVYYGTESGVYNSTEDKLTASDAEDSVRYGYAVSSAGDINLDGYDDVIVGAYGDNDNGGYSGSAYVYYGSSAGVDIGSEQKITASDGSTDSHFGSTVSGAGDVNGDKYTDVIVGAHFNNLATGSVYIYYGSEDGIIPGSEQKITSSDRAASDFFGVSVSDIGDVNGDDYADIIIGAYGDDDLGSSCGSAYIYYGSADGIDIETEMKLTASDGAEGHHFGIVVSDAGDINGDDHTDVVIGAFGDDEYGTESGSVYIYYGTSDGIDPNAEEKLASLSPTEGEQFGITLAPAGDYNGDGLDDLLVGAPGGDTNGDMSGAAYLYFGSSTGIDVTTGHTLTASDGEAEDSLSQGVAGVGDVNNDGLSDLLVGVHKDDDSGDDSGSALLFYGWADADQDGIPHNEDCDDDDETIGSAETYYNDNDGDGFGDPNESTESCDPPSGTVLDNTDCADDDPDVHPGATEVPYDGVDNDCDDEDLTDLDQDGHDDESVGGDDCDDNDASTNPSGKDIPGDGIDQDCDGQDAEGSTDTEATLDNGEEIHTEGCNCSSAPTRIGSVVIWLLGFVAFIRRRQP